MSDDDFAGINLPKSPVFMKGQKTAISLKISQTMVKALDDVSDHYGMNRTALVNYVLDHFLQNEIRKGVIRSPKG